MTNDLTSGNLLTLIIKFAFPILLGNIFLHIYQISDMIIVGRLIGVDALAAVGATAPIFLVFIMIAFGFTSGLCVITAQRFGAKDYEGVKKSAFHSMIAGLIVSLLMTLILTIFLKKILHLM